MGRLVIAAALACYTLAGCGGRKHPRSTPAADASTDTIARPTSIAQVSTDARVELLSILFRLAGAPDYHKGLATPYLAAVDAHFARFADDPAVVASRVLQQQHGISYNAPVGLAVYLDAVTLQPRVPLEPLPPGLDVRWRGLPVAEYLALVRAFRKRSDFDSFFAAQLPYRTAVEARLQVALAGKDTGGWLARWYGSRPEGNFIIIPGLITGPWNYGASTTIPGQGHTAYQIIQLERVDAEGLPQPSHDTLALLAHEMSHAYVNPLIERHAAELEAAATPLFTAVQAAMSRAAYPSWRLMVQESCVRAVTLLYARAELDEAAARDTLARDHAAGFTWIEALAKVLETQRAGGEAGVGVTLEAMVPALAGFFTSQTPVPQR